MPPVHWLQRRTGVDRQLRAVEILSWSLVALLLLGGLGVVAWVQAEFGDASAADVREAVRLLNLLLLMGALAAPVLPVIVAPAVRAARTAVGVDGDRVLLGLRDGRNLEVAAGALRHSRHGLHHGPITVPVRDRRGRSLYAAGELETRLEPLLSPANALTAWAALRHQWAFRDPVLLWPLAGVAVLLILLAVVLVLLSTHPGVFGGPGRYS